MNYVESIKKIKDAVTGYYPVLMQRCGCTKPTIVSAFNRTSAEQLTTAERKVINEGMKLAAELSAKNTSMEQSVITMAQTL